MKDYGRIISKIGATPWLMTPEGLNMILGIVDRHIQGVDISVEDLEAIQLKSEERHNGNSNKAGLAGGIGVIPIHGPIFGKANMMTKMSGATSLESFQQNFREMINSADISSIILDMDTPGGTSDLVQEVGKEIYEARGAKPIYSIANTMAASAGLWLASQAEKFYVTPSGVVGSLGAVTVHTDQSESDKNEGLKYTFIHAGEHKVEGNPHEPISAEGIAYRQEMIDELYGDFVNAVAVGRDRDPEYVKANFGSGRMMTADKAVISGMVDGKRTFDELVGEIQSQPQKVQVVVNGTNVTGVISIVDGKYHLESKEWEHSEPGTGTPPTPRTFEDGSDDKGIKGKWRRNIPAEDDRSISPSPPPVNTNLNEGGEMETVQEQLYKLLGVANDEDLLNKVTAMHTEADALKSAVHVSSEESRLQTEFPKFWKQHLEDQAKSRSRDAKEFANSVTMFTRPEGEKLIKTGLGLSAVAIEDVEKFHLAFAEGSATLADFEAMISSITNGGILDYEEHGTENTNKVTNMNTLDTSTPVGLQSARKQFADVIAGIQTELSADEKNSSKTEVEIYSMAVSEAAKREPELAIAYRQAAPGKP